jgi:hypothetical protein
VKVPSLRTSADNASPELKGFRNTRKIPRWHLRANYGDGSLDRHELTCDWRLSGEGAQER